MIFCNILQPYEALNTQMCKDYELGDKRIMKMISARDLRKHSTPYWLIMPAVICVLIFTVYPMINLVYTSFFKVNQLNPAKTKFVGFQNYEKIFGKPYFVKSLRNTFTYTIMSVALITSTALFSAVLLGLKRTRFNRFIQAVIFTPHIVSSVAVAIIWTWLYEPTFGIFNNILKGIGLPTLKWLASSDTALISIVIVAVWKSFGYYCLIFISAISGISSEVFDACEVDGAAGFTKFFKIILPLISPQLFFSLIVLTINSFKVFELTRIMTNGGPSFSSSTLVLYIYRLVFLDGNLGQATATGVVLLTVVGIMTAFYFLLLNRKVHYQ